MESPLRPFRDGLDSGSPAAPASRRQGGLSHADLEAVERRLGEAFPERFFLRRDASRDYPFYRSEEDAGVVDRLQTLRAELTRPVPEEHPTFSLDFLPKGFSFVVAGTADRTPAMWERQRRTESGCLVAWGQFEADYVSMLEGSSGFPMVPRWWPSVEVPGTFYVRLPDILFHHGMHLVDAEKRDPLWAAVASGWAAHAFLAVAGQVRQEGRLYRLPTLLVDGLRQMGLLALFDSPSENDVFLSAVMECLTGMDWAAFDRIETERQGNPVRTVWVRVTPGVNAAGRLRLREWTGVKHLHYHPEVVIPRPSFSREYPRTGASSAAPVEVDDGPPTKGTEAVESGEYHIPRRPPPPAPHRDRQGYPPLVGRGFSRGGRGGGAGRGSGFMLPRNGWDGSALRHGPFQPTRSVLWPAKPAYWPRAPPEAIALVQGFLGVDSLVGTEATYPALVLALTRTLVGLADTAGRGITSSDLRSGLRRIRYEVLPSRIDERLASFLRGAEQEGLISQGFSRFYGDAEDRPAALVEVGALPRRAQRPTPSEEEMARRRVATAAAATSTKKAGRSASAADTGGEAAGTPPSIPAGSRRGRRRARSPPAPRRLASRRSPRRDNDEEMPDEGEEGVHGSSASAGGESNASAEPPPTRPCRA